MLVRPGNHIGQCTGVGHGGQEGQRSGRISSSTLTLTSIICRWERRRRVAS
jgi:hypothetical protein